MKIVVPRSRIAAYHIDEAGTPHDVRWTLNSALAAWGYAAAKALSEGGSKWTIRKVYIEFENVVSPGNAVSIPTIDDMNPEHGLPYYTDLSGSPSRDYLRVDLTSLPQIGIEAGYEGCFTAPEGNLLRAFAQSGGTAGVHGKAFSSAVNSKICGSALVVAPVESDPTQDIVVARGYFATGDQLLKLSGSQQVGITWEIPFVLPIT